MVALLSWLYLSVVAFYTGASFKAVHMLVPPVWSLSQCRFADVKEFRSLLFSLALCVCVVMTPQGMKLFGKSLSSVGEIG